MRAVQKTVYYCDYCRRHRLTKSAIEKHEPTCVRNPSRVCRWRIDGHSDGTRVVEVGPLAAEIKSRASVYPTSAEEWADDRTYLEKADIDWLRGEVDGCPACMLAALLQSGVDEFHTSHGGEAIFDYQTEVERIREEERREAEADSW